MQLPFDRNKLLLRVVAPFLLLAIFYFSFSLRPLASVSEAGVEGSARFFSVPDGAGFFDIVDQLKRDSLIKSSFAFKTLAILKGDANDLKAGRYRLSPTLSSFEILHLLVEGARREITVVIPEGSTVYEIDRVLSNNGVLDERELSRYAEAHALEGHLFPDTYRFFTGSNVEEVADKFLANFEKKATPILGESGARRNENLILASLLEKEVPDFKDMQIVAGIIKKRSSAGMPLQIDATICYIKEGKTLDISFSCYPLTPLDFKIESHYNTYLYPGWPLGPISNPGENALRAAVSPKKSPYWYYLSDPVSKKTIFAQTLDEHNQNRFKYLK